MRRMGISKSGLKRIAQLLEGGLAEEKGVTSDEVDPEQLAMGIKVELEHTHDKNLAKEIAMDHLSEIPDYYTRLKKMEQEALEELNGNSGEIEQYNEQEEEV